MKSSDLQLNKVKSQLSGVTKQQKIYGNKNTLRPYLLESFKNSSDFSLTNCTVSMDTTNYMYGTGALKVDNTTAGGTSYVVKSMAMNLSDAQTFEMRVYVPDTSKLYSIGVFFVSANGNFNAIKTVFKTGWNTLRWGINEFTKVNNVAWTDAFNSLQFAITSRPSLTAEVTIEYFKKNVKDEANVVFVMDDGFASAYNVGIPYLESKGFKGNVAVAKTFIGTVNYMTLAQIKDLYARGHDVLNHSTSHPNMTSYTYTACAKEIQDMREYLYQNGLTRGNDIFVYPVSYSDIAKQVIKDLGFVIGRDGSDNFPTYGLPDDFLNISCMPLNTTSTLSTFTTWFDSVVQTGGTVFAYCHNISDTPIAGEIATSLFTSIIDYVYSKSQLGLCNVITMSEWYNGLF